MTIAARGGKRIDRLRWLLIAALMLGPGPATKSKAKPRPRPRDDRNWRLMQNAGTKAFQQGYFDKAAGIYAKALDEAERFGDDDHRVARSLTMLAESNRMLAKFPIAQPMYLRAIEIQKKIPSEFTITERASPLVGLGLMETSRGLYADAETHLEKALDLEEKALKPDDIDLANPLLGLAEVDRLEGKLDRSESLFRRALDIREKHFGRDHRDLAMPLIGLARVQSELGKNAEAEATFQRAVPLCERLGHNHPEVAIALFGLAELYRGEGKLAEAEPLYRRALDISEKGFRSDHIHAGYCLGGLATLETQLDRLEEAKKDFRRSRDILEKNLGEDHPDVARLWLNNSNLLRKLKQDAEADELAAKAQAILSRPGRPGDRNDPPRDTEKTADKSPGTSK